MATIIELRNAGKLVWLDPMLEAREQEWRSIYMLPAVTFRILNELPQWQSQWRIEQSPSEQVDALAEVFCSGAELTYSHQFKPLVHLQGGVWELKTPDVRLFGWFPVRDTFIAGAIDEASRVKTHNLYVGYAGQVGRDRNQLPLDEPKFIASKDPNDVVSNFSYP